MIGLKDTVGLHGARILRDREMFESSKDIKSVQLSRD